MFIEFFGSPGVGKSHITKYLDAILQGSCFSRTVISSAISSRQCFIANKLKLLLIGALRYGCLALRLMKFDLRGFRFVLFYNWLIVLGGYALASDRRTIILDQGMMQLLWSADFRLKDRELADYQLSLLAEKS